MENLRSSVRNLEYKMSNIKEELIDELQALIFDYISEENQDVLDDVADIINEKFLELER